MAEYFDGLETMSRSEREAYQDDRIARMVRLGYEK